MWKIKSGKLRHTGTGICRFATDQEMVRGEKTIL